MNALTNIKRTAQLVLLLSVSTSWFNASAAYDVGDIAEDFTITNRLDGGNISLSDYEGHIIVLDFFAYWCGPCQSSSPDLEVNVADYYEQAGGNAHGLPVVVIPINLESRNESQTDLFIANAGLKFVANDYVGSAWKAFSVQYIPHFAVINGVEGSESHAQWEVLHSDSGYNGAEFIKRLVDSVEAPLGEPESFDFKGWSNSDNYPYVYSSTEGWLYFLPSDGGLWIYKFASEQWIMK